MEKRGTAYLGLGSNEGDRVFNLAEAVRRIQGIEGTRLAAVSPLYETSPVDVAGGPFLNAVAIVKTDRDPRTLMKELQRIESGMGRTRNAHGPEARNIDIDLLLYDEQVIEETWLKLPHPRISERRFVLEPLVDLVPELRIPNIGKTVSQMASALRDRCPDQVIVKVGRLEQH